MIGGERSSLFFPSCDHSLAPNDLSRFIIEGVYLASSCIRDRQGGGGARLHAWGGIYLNANNMRKEGKISLARIKFGK